MSLLLCLAVLCGLLSGCQAKERTLSDEEKNRIGARFAAYTHDRGFSGSVYAVHRGEVLFDAGAGMATETAENGSQVVYGVASLTKQFTAAAIMQLYDEGKLDIEEKLSVYFPDYRFGGRITLEQLLCHRSGIPDYSVESVGSEVVVSCDGSDDGGITVTADSTADENRRRIRELFLSKDLLFEPGERFNYSDSNYALLAEIVAIVSGEDQHSYLREHIFTPLGMETAAFIDDYAYDGTVTVAETDRDEFSMNYYDYKGLEYGCGDILCSPSDLYRWYRGFCGGKVVSDSAYERMTQNYSSPDERGYGFGLELSGEGGSKVLYHFGYIPSYYSSVIYLPEHDYFEALLSNHAYGHPQRTAADMAVYFGSVIGLDLEL